MKNYLIWLIKKIGKKYLSFCFFYFISIGFTIGHAKDIIITGHKTRVVVNSKGAIKDLSFNVGKKWEYIDFRNDSLSGPTFHLNHNPIQLKQVGIGARFETQLNGIVYKLSYQIQDSNLVLHAAVQNKTFEPYLPTTLGLIIGLDALMETYPKWNTKHFPTLLRAEKTHFWGYAMSPAGSIVGIASPDSVASWSIDYFKDHYVKTFNIDFLNKNPLPDHHPHALNKLMPGETKSWSIYLCHINKLSDLKPVLANLCQAPMIEAKGAYTLAQGEKKTVEIFSEVPFEASLTSPRGDITILKTKHLLSNRWELFIAPKGDFGRYKLIVRTRNGKQSEGLFYLREPWSYYLAQARDQILLMPPQSNIYAESYYSGYTTYLGKINVPDKTIDASLDSTFQAILPKMFNYSKGNLYVIPNVRVQSLYTGIGILTDAYKAYGRISDLDLASRLADYLVHKFQGADGAYRNSHGTIYTSVIYGAKSMFELAVVERKLGKTDTLWQHRAERHGTSAKLAIADLYRRLDNIETEGEQTFEDGMISCSALQLGFFALQTDDKQEKKRYTEALRYMLNKHSCLEQSEIPDARMNGGTLRFWEAWYDIRLKPHVLNSPHGWSSWKTYATYYMYLLTGEEKWLKETMDAVGSAMQVIDVNKNGYLSWGFIPDPYVKATYAVEDSLHKGKTIFKTSIIGEEYRPLTLRYRKDHGGDNTVFEHFKMLVEVALKNAFVIEHKDGTFLAYNCAVNNLNGVLQIQPYEKSVTAIHLNLIAKHQIKVKFYNGAIHKDILPGLSWIKSINWQGPDAQ